MKYSKSIRYMSGISQCLTDVNCSQQQEIFRHGNMCLLVHSLVKVLVSNHNSCCCITLILLSKAIDC